MRDDWMVSAWCSTALVVVMYTPALIFGGDKHVLVGGAFAVVLTPLVANLSFVVMGFNRARYDSPYSLNPLMRGLKYGVLGGFAYGVCFGIGVGSGFFLAAEEQIDPMVNVVLFFYLAGGIAYSVLSGLTIGFVLGILVSLVRGAARIQNAYRKSNDNRTDGSSDDALSKRKVKLN